MEKEDVPFQNYGQQEKELTNDEKEKLDKQNSRLVTDFRAEKFQKESAKHWDLFYKRNTTKFFKDRHWTCREFNDLVEFDSKSSKKVLLEVGCGVGNFIFPQFLTITAALRRCFT